MGTPTHEELCRLAYRFWEERGCPEGSPEVDWQRAEHELRLAEREEDALVHPPAPADRPERTAHLREPTHADDR